MRIPPISTALYEKLLRIPPLPDMRGGFQRACAALLADERQFDRVLFVELEAEIPNVPRIRLFDPASSDPAEHILAVLEQQSVERREIEAKESSIAIKDIVDVMPSPCRLPDEIYRKLSEAGETGMGYQLFDLHFSNGRTVRYLSGGFFAFPELPEGLTAEMIVAATPLDRGHSIEGAFGDAEFMRCEYSPPPHDSTRQATT